MDAILLSDLERYYIIQGAEIGCRIDGRKPNEYRPIEIETKVLSHVNGSASIRIGDTYIMCSVKMEVGKPLLTRPNEGRVEINVECYPTATFNCNEKTSLELAESLQTTLQSSYQFDFLDLKSFGIQSGRQCWIIYVDLLILEGAGNLLDASSLVIKAALIDATLSDTFKVFLQQKSKKDDLSNSKFDGTILPIFSTVHKIGSTYVIDASKEEETCSVSRFSAIVYPDGSIGTLTQEGLGSCQLETIVEMSDLAVTIGKDLNARLIDTLNLEKQLRS